MSVRKGDRTTSNLEFLRTARELQIHTIKKCANFPKRYTFYVSQPLVNSATRVYEYVKKGNSIYPVNQHEAQIRRDYFLKANAELYSIVSQIEVAHEIFGFELEAMYFWIDIVDREIDLVKGVLKTDRARYKDLPNTIPDRISKAITAVLEFFSGLPSQE